VFANFTFNFGGNFSLQALALTAQREILPQSLSNVSQAFQIGTTTVISTSFSLGGQSSINNYEYVLTFPDRPCGTSSFIDLGTLYGYGSVVGLTVINIAFWLISFLLLVLCSKCNAGR
jgi:hypothetical protein